MGRHAYILFMFLSAAVFLAARHFVPKPPGIATLPLWKRLALLWAVLIGAAFGAKIGYTVAYGGDWLASGTWLTDGKTVTTGLLGAYVAVELMKWVLCIHVKTGDTFALPLALAMSVGRWGCFFNGCCYGTPTDLPWGIDFGDGSRRHPTQIYESLFHLSMAVLIGWLMARDLCRTHLLQLYLIAYAVFRFATEFIRPEEVWLLGLTFYQWVCIAMAAGLAGQWWYEERRGSTVLGPARAAE